MTNDQAQKYAIKLGHDRSSYCFNSVVNGILSLYDCSTSNLWIWHGDEAHGYDIPQEKTKALPCCGKGPSLIEVGKVGYRLQCLNCKNESSIVIKTHDDSLLSLLIESWNLKELRPAP